MALITIDMETFYDTEYSLSRLSEVDYIKDPRFECLMCSIKIGDGTTEVFVGRQDVARRFAEIDWSTSAVLAHNARFDCSILAWHFGYVPKLYCCSLSMSRATTHWTIGRSSLAKVADYLGLPAKGDEVLKAKGKRLQDFSPHELDLYKKYCARDTDLCHAIFTKMRPLFRASELTLIDMIARMFILPQVKLNAEVLQQNYDRVLADKAAALKRVSAVPKEVFSSQPKFAALLEEHGVEVPMKVSPSTGDQIPALAKGDWAFKELCADDSLPTFVQLLLAARVSEKSTLEETRSRNMLNLALKPWRVGVGWAPIPLKYSGARNMPALAKRERRIGTGWFPVPLRYSGAKTHRLSGDGGINCMHPDIELLTPDGWQRVEDWQPGTAIIQWWPDGRLDWCADATKMRRDNCEELVWFEGPAIRGGFTPDHRMVSISAYTGEVKERTAGWLADHSGMDNIPKAGLFVGSSPISVEQVRVLCMVAADGSISKTKGHAILGFKKPRKIERCAELLQAAEVPFTCHTGDVTTFRVAKANISWIKKGYGPWVLALQPDVADALLDELVYWDGHPNSRTGACTFFTIHRDQAEWVQTLGALRGRRASLYEYKFPEASTGKKYHVYFGTSRYASTRIGGITRQVYGGPTYCPSVGSSYVLARYDGSIFVTGQCQNLPRGSLLRTAIEAPAGWRIVHRDASQIEARMTAWLAKCGVLLDAFREGRDVYSEFASIIYSRDIDPKVDKLERFVGKTAILGLGYGCGPDKFRKMLFIGNGGVSVKIDLETAEVIVANYRAVYHQIPALWQYVSYLLKQIIKLSRRVRYDRMPYGIDYSHIPIDFDYDCFILPNGLKISYPSLRQDNTTAQMLYDDPNRNDPIYVYGAKGVENISQALSRIILTDIAVRLYKLTGYRPFLSTHDSLDLCVPEKDAEAIDDALRQQFAYVPDWAKGLPLASEGGWGRNLTAAERKDNR